MTGKYGNYICKICGIPENIVTHPHKDCMIQHLTAQLTDAREEIKALNTQIDIEVCNNIVHPQRAEEAEAKLATRGVLVNGKEEMNTL